MKSLRAQTKTRIHYYVRHPWVQQFYYSYDKAYNNSKAIDDYIKYIGSLKTPTTVANDEHIDYYTMSFDRTPFWLYTVATNTVTHEKIVKEYDILQQDDYVMYNFEYFKERSSEIKLSQKFFLITDLDGTLMGDSLALLKFNKFWLQYFRFNPHAKLIYNTGRNILKVNEFIYNKDLIWPDICISNIGTKIFFQDKEQGQLLLDSDWIQLINEKWDHKYILGYLKRFDWLKFEVSTNNELLIYCITDKVKEELFVKEHLQQMKEDLGKVNLEFFFSVSRDDENIFLSFCPINAGKLKSMNYLVNKFNCSAENVLCCGDSSNDIEMLENCRWGLLVSNAYSEARNWYDIKGRNLKHLKFSEFNNANAILREISERFNVALA